MEIKSPGQVEPKYTSVPKVGAVFYLFNSPVFFHYIFIKGMLVLHCPVIDDNEPCEELPYS